MSKREIYRILDVAANRGREALRVVEDAARFLDDNEQLTNALKATRHRFAAAAEKLDRRERLLARDTIGDVGTTLETEDEYRRSTLVDVLTANFARLQESARSLEEFSKIVAPQLAREWERIRYDSYTLEKLAYEAATKHEENESVPQTSEPTVRQVQAIEAFEEPQTREPAPSQSTETPAEERVEPANAQDDQPDVLRQTRLSMRDRRRKRLARSGMCAYVDRPLLDVDAVGLFNSKVDVFQLCFDPNSQAESAETAQRFLNQFFSAFPNETSVAKRPLLLSRGFAVWGTAFDGGVVVNQDYREVREQIGDDYLLGAVVSNLQEALAALRAGQEGVLDFIEAGPVFTSQENKSATGTAFLRAILEAVDGQPPIPIFAFGGITPENCAEIFDSGIERLGVGAAILDAQNKRDAAMGLTDLF